MSERFSPGEKETSPENKSERVKREIFDMAGERTLEQAFKLVSDVRDVLSKEKEEGKGCLEDTIQEIKEGPNGEKYFMDGNVSYMPGEGEAVIIGDIHGDADAIISIMEQSGFIENMEEGGKDMKLIFAGDYADRGEEGIKALEIVLDLKKRYPDNIVLMRGNHEELEPGMNAREDENCLFHTVINKYYPDEAPRDKDLFIDYNKLFEHLPGVLVAENGLVVTHGGIPNEEITSLKKLNDIEILEQMRWNDPHEIPGTFPNVIRDPRRKVKLQDKKYKFFGPDVFKKFMDTIGASVMIRSHEDVIRGARLLFKDKFATIFSNGGPNSTSSAYDQAVKTPKFARVRLDQPKDKWRDSDFEEVRYKI